MHFLYKYNFRGFLLSGNAYVIWVVNVESHLINDMLCTLSDGKHNTNSARNSVQLRMYYIHIIPPPVPSSSPPPSRRQGLLLAEDEDVRQILRFWISRAINFAVVIMPFLLRAAVSKYPWQKSFSERNGSCIFLWFPDLFLDLFRSFGLTMKFHVSSTITYFVAPLQPARSSRDYERQATAAAVAVSYCLHQKAVFRHVLQRINQPTNTAIQSASYNQPTDAD